MPQRLKILVCAMFFLSGCVILKAQPLQTEDTIAIIQFKNLFNYESKEQTIPNPSGKPIILDFWSTSCMACIKSFPMMDSLQREFRDSIQIILVNKQSADSLHRFFSKRKNIKTPSLTMITGDTLLNQLFPHDSEPFHVWLDGKGVIKLITGGENTTAKNIRSFLNKASVQVNEYKTKKYTGSLLDTTWQRGVEYYSGITHCIRDIHLSGGGLSGLRSITMNCNSVVEMYLEAFTGKKPSYYDVFRRKGRVILEAAEPYKYTRPSHGDFYPEWQSKFCYNYQLIVPESKGDEKYEMMKEDLERYFNLEVRIEKRNVPCFVLVRISPDIKLKELSLINNKQGIVMRIEDSLFYLSSQTYVAFSSKFFPLFEYYFSKPIEDSTGITGEIQYGISSKILSTLDMGQLKTALKKFGLDLVEKNCFINVLVIRDKLKLK